MNSVNTDRPVSHEQESGNLGDKVTELQSANRPVNKCCNVNPYVHMARAGEQLVITPWSAQPPLTT